MTIFERALELVGDGMTVGLGSGRASNRFIELLGARVHEGLRVRGVPTSDASAQLAMKVGVPLVSLEEGMPLDLAVDGADEVDSQLNMIKGYGRALLREKVIAAAAKRFVILVGREKLVDVLGSRGRLPVEVVPFAVPLVLQRLRELGCPGTLDLRDGRPFVSDNGNCLIDCAVSPTGDPHELEQRVCSIPGVVDTGLFLGMADVVLVGDDKTFELQQELNANRT